MTDKQAEAFLSKKGRALHKLMREIEQPVYRRTESLSMRLPARLMTPIDALAKRTKRTRSEVVVMFLDAVLNEMAAEGSEAVRGLIGKGEKKEAPVEGKKASA